MTTKFEAIKAINPNIILSQNGDKFTIHNDEKMPTDEEIQSKLKEFKADYDSKKYQRDRLLEYPQINDQLDMIYWDKKNGTKKWEEAIDKVKADHPKMSEQ